MITVPTLLNLFLFLVLSEQPHGSREGYLPFSKALCKLGLLKMPLPQPHPWAFQWKQWVSLKTATANWSPLANLSLLEEVILACSGSPFPVITTRQMAFKLHPKKLTGHLSF